MNAQKKHIVLDTRIIDTSTGIYMQRLIYFIEKLAPEEFTWTILVPTDSVKKYQALCPHLRFEACDVKWYTVAEQLELNRQLRALQPDLVHFTMPQQPLLYTSPAVTTIHDTTLLRFDVMSPDDVWLKYKIQKFVFGLLVRKVIRRAKRILVPTYYVKNDLVDFMHGKYADTYTVTHEAGEAVLDEPETLESLVGKKYFFFVGNAFPYKNIRRTIDAFRVFQQSHSEFYLALAGKKDVFYEQLEKEVMEQNIPHVQFLGRISDGEKRWAFAHAEAFVTASLTEGFHIPMHEAFFENCPVISSNATCLPEVGGDAALYFDPHSTPELVEKMNSLVGNDKLRQDLVARGQEQLKKFSWEKCVSETLEVYREVLQTE